MALKSRPKLVLPKFPQPEWLRLPAVRVPTFLLSKWSSRIGIGISVLAFFLFSLAVLVVTYKGDAGSYDQASRSSAIGSPFEATNTSSRYALTEAIVENGSLELNEKQARFSAPDLIYVNNKFYSIFTPGVSFLAVPFYQLGKHWMTPEFTTFGLNLVFALLNVLLIIRLTHKLTGSVTASLFAGLTFLFASNAHAYALTLTQHHGAIFIMLLGIFAALRKPGWLNGFWFGLLCGLGLLFDFPNLFIMLPIGIFMLGQYFTVSREGEKTKLTLKLSLISILLGIIPLVGLYGWYNTQTVGSPTGVAQFVGRTNYFDTAEQKAELALKKETVDVWQSQLPFSTRLQLQGAHILFVSNERSWLHYSPILLTSLFGVWYATRTKELQNANMLFVFIFIMNVLVYISVGDPWGGWSFGPRYLLPGAAIAAVYVGMVVARWQRFLPGLIFIGYLLWTSVWINSMGALTSAHIPPKQETIALGNDLPYTWELNKRMVDKNQSSSFVYNVWLKDSMTVATFHNQLATVIASVGWVLLAVVFLNGVLSNRKSGVK